MIEVDCNAVKFATSGELKRRLRFRLGLHPGQPFRPNPRAILARDRSADEFGAVIG